MTYSQIISKIQVSKSSLSGWVGKMVLSPAANRKLIATQNRHLIKARKIATIKRESKNKEDSLIMQKNLQPLVRRARNLIFLKIALAFLYLGEGARWKTHRGLQLGSSDHVILSLYIHMLKRCYNIDKTFFRCYICYRADQNLTELTRYWSKTLKIPISQFNTTSKPDRRTIGKPTRKSSYMGVCIISCRGTKIQQELEMIPKLILDGPLAQG